MAVTYTVGRLAREHGLSRSTLLYYDRIGLLRPSGRSGAGYRLYTEADRRRLEAICRYREVGVPLAEIGEILDRADGTAAMLERRLEMLNDEMARLREQQRTVVRLLQNHPKVCQGRALTKERWVALLEATGLDEADMRRWHVEFERMAPEAHRDFLESLGIGADEIRRIRGWSRGDAQRSAQHRKPVE